MSAVVRAFFKNRLYFKFNPDRFFPYTQEQVEQLLSQRIAEEKRLKHISRGARWLEQALSAASGPAAPPVDEDRPIIEILQSVYLFGKDSEHYAIGKEILSKAGIRNQQDIFLALVNAGVWDENINTDLIRNETPIDFSPEVLAFSGKIALQAAADGLKAYADSTRRDLRHLSLMTIDGQATLDYDDALSLEPDEDGYRMGIHIIDVGHFVRKDDPLDKEAQLRGSSVYMPDQKIPMLPAGLAEGLCSLKAGEDRPAISTVVKLSPALDLIDFEVFPSLVNVSRQLTYYDVNMQADEDPEIRILREIAAKFRQFRLEADAIQITLPETHVWLNADGEITVNRINRESPGRMLVSELMIMANWLMGRFLKERNIPAIFRSQPKPKERLYEGVEENLYKNIMQRRLLNRFALGATPEHHSGLGLDVYVTATSPIRKYSDLVTQRQIRAALKLEAPYTQEKIDWIIQSLGLPITAIARIQQRRHRYWILKYLEKQIGQKFEAIVLMKRRSTFQVLLPDFMLECDLPLHGGIDLTPEDLVQVTIQRVNAREELLTLSIG
jgi:exoribonuclease-2